MDPELLAQARAVKGFMPDDEGLALTRSGCWRPARLGPLLEVGTYCGKSAVYLGAAAREAGAVLITVDHHRGSEENQPGWEHHDPDVVDSRTGRMDTLPGPVGPRRGLRPGGDVVLVVALHGGRRCGATPLALLFIDGGHGQAVAWADYGAWTRRCRRAATWRSTTSSPTRPRAGGLRMSCTARARASGWIEQEPLGCGSLRVLRRPG